MFIVNEKMKGLEEGAKIFSILHSINAPRISAVDRPAETTRAFICTLEEGSKFLAHIILYLTESRARVIYTWDNGPVPSSKRSEIEGEALDFVESMGFMMDNLNYPKLSAAQRKEVASELPIFRRDEEEIFPTHAPEGEDSALEDLIALSEDEEIPSSPSPIPAPSIGKAPAGKLSDQEDSGSLDLLEAEFARGSEDLDDALNSVFEAIVPGEKSGSTPIQHTPFLGKSSAAPAAPEESKGVKALVRLMASFCILALFLGCAAKVSEADVREANLRYQVAQQLFTRGETTQGMAELLKAEKLNPDDSEINNLLGLAYADRGMLEESEKHFKKAVTSDPDFSEAYNNYCVFLVARNRYDEAVAACTKAVENVTYTTPERAYHNMGVAYERKGDFPHAIEAYQKGLNHNKNFVMSHKALGVLYMNEGNTKKALEEFEEASQVCLASPKGSWGAECPEVFHRLALMYVKMKQRPKAVSALKNCLNSDKEGDYGKKCSHDLRLLE